MLITGVCILGLVVGSFLNVCIHRLPRDESLLRPVSHCPVCRVALRWSDNLPLVSFVLLRGRCRTCGTRISWQYPVVEGANALGYLVLVTAFGPTILTGIYGLLFSALLVITAIDLAHQIIPDEVTIPGLVLGLGLAALGLLPHGLMNALAGVGFGGGLFWLVSALYPGGMGGGDIKLMAMLGAFLGWQAVLVTTLVGASLGSFYGVGLMLFRGVSRKHPIPFGPFLSAGALVALFWKGWPTSLGGF